MHLHTKMEVIMHRYRGISVCVQAWHDQTAACTVAPAPVPISRPNLLCFVPRTSHSTNTCSAPVHPNLCSAPEHAHIHRCKFAHCYTYAIAPLVELILSCFRCGHAASLLPGPRPLPSLSAARPPHCRRSQRTFQNSSRCASCT